MSATTDTPTIEEIREARAQRREFNAPRYIDFLLSEVDRLKAENKRIQGKLTAWERSADATSGRKR